MRAPIFLLVLLSLLISSCAPAPSAASVLPAETALKATTIPTDEPTAPPAPTPTAAPSPTVAPTPEPTPPGTTSDPSSRFAITQHYMDVVYQAINYTDGQQDVNAFAGSPDGKYVAIGGCIQPSNTQCINPSTAGRSFLLLLDSDTAQVISALPETKTTITTVAFTNDSSKLVYSLYPQEIKVWDIAAEKVERTLYKGDAGSTYARMRISPDGTQVALVQRTSLLVLDFVTGAKVAEVPAVRVNADLPLYNADGSRILVSLSSDPPVLGVYDTTTWQIVSQMDLPNLSAVGYSADGKWVITVERADPPALLLWDAEKGIQAGRLEETFDEIFGITIAPDSRHLYVSGYGGPDDLGGLSVWDINTRTRLGVLYDWFPAYVLKFSPDGSSMLVGDYLQVWKWSSLTELIIKQREFMLEFYSALSSGDYLTAARHFQPGEYEVIDGAFTNGPPEDLAAQLESACEQGMIICKPVRILPGGGKTNLGDYVVYFNFLEADGSVFADPDGYTILNAYVSEGEDGLLKISYLP